MKNLLPILKSGHAVTSHHKNGLSISVLANPRKVFTDAQNLVYIDGLVDNLCTMINQSFGVELENKSDDGVRNHVANVDSIAFVHGENRVLGFASTRLIPDNHQVFYLHGVAVAQEAKGCGCAKLLIKELLRLRDYKKIVFTSQNPIMFCLLSSMCKKVYPSALNETVPEHIGHLGEIAVSGRPGRFNTDTLIANDIYGRCLYPSLPKSGSSYVDEWFKQALTAQSGVTRDAFLFVGEEIQ